MVGFFENELGRVQISPSIVRRIIMREVENSRCFRFPGMKGGESAGRKIMERCIKVVFVEGSVETTLTLTVLFGTKIIKEARELQGRITRALELTAGLVVNRVALNVENVYTVDEPLLLEHDTIPVNAVNQ